MSGAYPPLLALAEEAAYRAHFHATYCAGPIATFDGIEVRFRRHQFAHCCFESTRRNGEKDRFSPLRAERLDWIKVALQDGTASRYQGWNKDKRRYENDRRVTVVCGNFVVVIALTGTNTADFVTCYVADSPDTLAKIKRSPKWT